MAIWQDSNGTWHTLPHSFGDETGNTGRAWVELESNVDGGREDEYQALDLEVQQRVLNHRVVETQPKASLKLTGKEEVTWSSPK